MRVLIVCSGNFKNFSFEINQAFIYDQVLAIRTRTKEFEIFTFFIVGKGVVGYLRNYQKLVRYLKQNKIDLIHAHFSLSSLLSNFQRKTPVVTTFHGSDINNPGTKLFSLIAYFTSKSSIFVNEYLYNKLPIKRKTKFSRIIPCGVDISLFNQIDKITARKLMNLDNTKTFCLFSSSFDNEIKNFRLAQDSVSDFQDRDIEFIELKGYKRNEVSLLLNAVDLALMTSLSEGSPQFIKEALACNCPIVSTDVGDVRQVIGNTEGCYITSFDPTDVAKKIQLALDYSQNKGRTNGRKRILELCLDSESIADKIIEVYNEVLKY